MHASYRYILNIWYIKYTYLPPSNRLECFLSSASRFCLYSFSPELALLLTKGSKGWRWRYLAVGGGIKIKQKKSIAEGLCYKKGLAGSGVSLRREGRYILAVEV